MTILGYTRTGTYRKLYTVQHTLTLPQGLLLKLNSAFDANDSSFIDERGGRALVCRNKFQIIYQPILSNV